MEQLNQNINILYYNDYIRNCEHISLVNYQNSLKGIGFVGNIFGTDYEYSGDQPAQALEALLQHQPLFSDCKTAKNLCIILAFKEQIGNEEFNAYIIQQFNSFFSFKSQFIMKLPLNTKRLLYCPPFEFTAKAKPGLDVNTVKPGDSIYIVMLNGATFHQSSELNGYHLFCSGRDL